MGYEWKNQYLVGGFNPSEKYYIVSWGYYSKYMGKKTCSKPPTRYDIYKPQGGATFR